jgi:hypothetical protein
MGGEIVSLELGRSGMTQPFKLDNLLQHFKLEDLFAAMQAMYPDIEDGKVFERREPRFNNGQEWEEATDYLPEWNWRWVEAEAKGMKGELPEPRNMPTIAGVVFLGLVDGKHQCRPATEDEIRQARPEPSGGILGLLAKAAARIQGGQ